MIVKNAELKVNYKHRFDSTTMNGAITRGGRFIYPDGVRIKDWDNLVSIFNETDHLPLYGSKRTDSHKEDDDRLIGFAWNFTPVHDTQQMYADVEFFDDIYNLSDLEDISELPVSIAFKDITPLGAGTQKITKLHHLAVSLNANEQDRCSMGGGLPCAISMKTVSDFGRSSSSNGDLVKLKKKEKILMPKKDKVEIEDEDEIREDSASSTKMTGAEKPATPDNSGSATHKVDQNTKNAKQAFMLDCQKYGPYQESQCNNAWETLNGSPAGPIKTPDKSEESSTDIKKTKDMSEERLDRIESILADFATILPTLTDVVKEKESDRAIEMIRMKEDLVDAGFCEDMLGKMTDFIDLKRFYQRVTTNKSLFQEPSATEVLNTNTSRLLGKRQVQNDMKEYEDMIETAKQDALSRFYKKSLPVEVAK